MVFTAKLYLQQERNGAGGRQPPPPPMCVLGWENGMCGRGLTLALIGVLLAANAHGGARLLVDFPGQVSDSEVGKIGTC